LPVVDLAALSAQGVAQARQAAHEQPSAPILDTLAQQWKQSTNQVFPVLVVSAIPLVDGDLVLVLNPPYLRAATPAELGKFAQELAITWRAVLATAGTLWPEVPGYEPGILIVQVVRTPRGERPVLLVDSRDGHTTVARRLNYSPDSVNAIH
jgi:hypothetical protein